MAVNIASNVAEQIAGLTLACARHGVVAVDRGTLHSRAVCTCGWHGRQHLLVAAAIHDAHMHGAQNRCRPAIPLLIQDLAAHSY